MNANMIEVHNIDSFFTGW